MNIIDISRGDESVENQLHFIQSRIAVIKNQPVKKGMLLNFESYLLTIYIIRMKITHQGKTFPHMAFVEVTDYRFRKKPQIDAAGEWHLDTSQTSDGKRQFPETIIEPNGKNGKFFPTIKRIFCRQYRTGILESEISQNIIGPSCGFCQGVLGRFLRK